MGRNNRARRQQKQRQNRGKQKNSRRATNKPSIALPELEYLCDPLVICLARGEPPPQSIMESWVNDSVSPAGRDFRQLLIDFIHYTFYRAPAKGSLQTLLPQRKSLEKIDLPWLYPLLYAYCLVSQQSELGSDLFALAEVVDKDIDCDLKSSPYDPTGVLLAPFVVLMWVAGHPNGNPHVFEKSLRFWLEESPLQPLIKPLQKFLKLKAPKASQKTVMALETALASVQWRRYPQWRDALKQLLSLFLRLRLSAKQREEENWQSCPQLSQLAGILETREQPQWTTLDFADANTATLHQLQHTLNIIEMPYVERLTLEALKCRLLSKYGYDDPVLEDEFDHQLKQLLQLLSSGVPRDHKETAEKCLEHTIEWLSQLVSDDQIPIPRATKKLSRLCPNDYRVQLMSHMKYGSSTATARTEQDLQQVHFPLFFKALDDEDVDFEEFSMGLYQSQLLDHFYWPLTAEARKTLFNLCFQRVLLVLDDFDAEEFGELWSGALFDANEAPFDAIVKGRPCELELLFHTALAALAADYGVDWLTPEQKDAVCRYGKSLLDKSLNAFGKHCVIELLQRVAGPQKRKRKQGKRTTPGKNNTTQPDLFGN